MKKLTTPEIAPFSEKSNTTSDPGSDFDENL